MSDTSHTDGASAEIPMEERRPFLIRMMAALVGTVVGVVPLVTGLFVFFDPLRRSSAAGKGKLIRVTRLANLPADGRPYRFQIIDERRDAWSLYPPEPIGAVYLRRTSPGEKPVAFTAECPHLGCSVDFQPADGQYKCPCHNSSFALDGSIANLDETVSPRGLDPLEVEVQDDDVFVRFQTFRTGISERIPK